MAAVGVKGLSNSYGTHKAPNVSTENNKVEQLIQLTVRRRVGRRGKLRNDGKLMHWRRQLEQRHMLLRFRQKIFHRIFQLCCMYIVYHVSQIPSRVLLIFFSNGWEVLSTIFQVLRVYLLQCESKKSPLVVFWNFFPNGWEFLINFYTPIMW